MWPWWWQRWQWWWHCGGGQRGEPLGGFGGRGGVRWGGAWRWTVAPLGLSPAAVSAWPCHCGGWLACRRSVASALAPPRARGHRVPLVTVRVPTRGPVSLLSPSPCPSRPYPSPRTRPRVPPVPVPVLVPIPVPFPGPRARPCPVSPSLSPPVSPCPSCPRVCSLSPSPDSSLSPSPAPSYPCPRPRSLGSSLSLSPCPRSPSPCPRVPSAGFCNDFLIKVFFMDTPPEPGQLGDTRGGGHREDTPPRG